MDKPHKNLNVWKKAVELSILVYEITESFPKSELYPKYSEDKQIWYVTNMLTNTPQNCNFN